MNSTTPLVACTGGLRRGGSTTFLTNLGHGFKERGLALGVISLEEENEMAADFIAAGVAVQIAPRRKLIYEDRIRFAYSAIAATKPAAALASLGSESFEVLRVLPPSVARLGIIQSDDPLPYEMVRHYADSLDAIVGVSEAICARLSQETFAGRVRIEHIPYGIHFPPAMARSARSPSGPLRLIYVGRMIETQKRVSRLAELAETLSANGENFEFTLAGDGPELAALKEKLKHLPNVRFTGNLPNTEVAALLRQHDVFVLLSDYEGLPLSLLEAMGEGLVPVVSDLASGMRQVVNTNTGFLVPVGDIRSATDCITLLARDPARLAAMSVRAADFARKQFSARLMAERYLQLTRELAGADAPWPIDVLIPPPLIVRHPWLYQGAPRIARRLLKRVLNSLRASA